ncbi:MULTISPECIES: hypothetical protein [Peribacillus]|nr:MULTISPECIES: hypothetical protein [unclassified Peribacillus]MCK1985578.1 hypothetical protein [Peribacillus sp. Aquil_B1]MCK2007689.1 hypothetical protein [Peribacillus sp. Aquil_B8]
MKKHKQDLVVLPSHFFGEEGVGENRRIMDEQKWMTKLLLRGLWKTANG